MKERTSTHTPSMDDFSIINIVDKIIHAAIQCNASDIHFEPYEQHYRIRFRQDGILTTYPPPPAHLSARIAARVKIMANLDISERRLPQDGRFSMNHHDTPIHFRVSTCPTVHGEKIVLRLLDTRVGASSIDALGFSDDQKTYFLNAITQPQGMILVTGPTGSGKTMTLYSAINHLNTAERNISTVEDPVEIQVPGINQVQINPKSGLTFASILRAFLRQDPDVIMLGEIRDLETAEIAIKAAQTGHLVLSTLHTNSASETLSRLMSMGVATFNMMSALRLIIAQRLLRRLCDACKIPHQGIYKAQGCPSCSQGYLGRIVIAEMMPISTTHVFAKSPHDILKQAQAAGMKTLYQAGLEKINHGLTTLEELHRVLVS